MDKQCRLCARPSNDAIFYNLFDPEENYLHYVKKIHKLLPIVINEFDPLPKVLCHRCAFKISDFYEFRINCLRTQESFKTKLPWFNSNQAEGSNNIANVSPMVELKINSIEHFSFAEKLNANTSLNQDDSLIVIDDDESFAKPMDEGNTFRGEDKDSDSDDRLEMKIRKNQTAKKTSVWDAKNSNHFGKHKKRRKKSCKIDQIFSTPTSVYQNMGQLDVIDPSEFINAQGRSNNKVDDIKKSGENTLNSQEVSESGSSDIESRLPSFILVTKIPNVGNAYTCKLCRRTFLAAASAVKHDCDTMSQHTKEPNSESNALTTNINGAEDLYICDVCNKVFPRQAILFAHKKQHFVTDSSSDSELETIKTKRHQRRNKKLRLDRQKRQLENEMLVQNENFSNDKVQFGI